MTYTATFTPQAWINDYAVDVDAEGPTTWTVTPEFTDGLDPETLRTPAYNDDLRDDPAAPEWIHEWSGPFEIHVER